MPQWTFSERDGLVEVDLGPGWPGFTETLADSLGTRAPRGHPAGLSTFWLDRTLERLDAWATPGTELANGNATELIRTESGVKACSIYDGFAEEEMPLEELRAGLLAWKAEVEARLRAD
jgi:hypothetical protein